MKSISLPLACSALLLPPSAFGLLSHGMAPTLSKSLRFENRMKNDDDVQESHEDLFPFPLGKSSEEAPLNLASRFATGKELTTLRSDVASLKETLHWAKAVKDTERCSDLEKAIAEGEAMDPDIVYRKALEEISLIKTSVLLSEDQKDFLIQQHKCEAEAARACLPRFQLEGLWVGK